MKALLPQIVAEVRRQHDLRNASLPDSQVAAMKRILDES
jgi:hypothetical protein